MQNFETLKTFQDFDWIHLRQIKTSVIVGCYPYERLHRQEIGLNLGIGIEKLEFSMQDNLELIPSVDYAFLHDRLLSFLHHSNAFTLERLALDIILYCFEISPYIQGLQVELHKPKALENKCEVSFSMLRFRHFTH